MVGIIWQGLRQTCFFCNNKKPKFIFWFVKWRLVTRPNWWYHQISAFVKKLLSWKFQCLCMSRTWDSRGNHYQKFKDQYVKYELVTWSSWMLYQHLDFCLRITWHKYRTISVHTFFCNSKKYRFTFWSVKCTFVKLSKRSHRY